MTFHIIFSYGILFTLLSLSYFTVNLSLKRLLKIGAYILLVVVTLLLYQASLIDQVSLILGLVFSTSSMLISLYTIEYSLIHNYPRLLELLMDLFLILLVSAYIAPNFILLIIAWTASEILGYILIKIGEEHSIEGSLTSSRGFIFTSTLTYELSVFTMITFSAFLTAGSIGITELLKPFTTQIQAYPISVVMIPLILLGFITKTALIPLHFWLPSAHSSAPSPASAALSGIMVSLGFYGLYRIPMYIDITPYKTAIAIYFAVTGVFSIIYSGLRALQQRDSKLLLAYLTIVTNGFISILFVMYLLYPSSVTLWSFILGIVMHTAYKTTLFAEAGVIEAIYNTRYIHGIGGILSIAPLSSIGGLLSVFTLFGVPGTIGFLVKLASIYNAILYFNENPELTILLLAGILAYISLTAITALRYSHIYFSKTAPRIEPVTTSVNSGLQLPILLLGSYNILLNTLVLVYGPWELTVLAIPLMLVPLLLVYLFYVRLRLETTLER